MNRPAARRRPIAQAGSLRLRSPVGALVCLALLAAVAPVRAQEGARSNGGGGSSSVSLNFDGVALKVVVQLVSQHTGKRFLIDENPDLPITLISSTPVAEEKLYAYFVEVLDAYGLAAVESGELVRIVSTAKAIQHAGALRDGRGAIDEFGTYSFALENIAAADLTKALEPLVPMAQTGALQAVGPSNLLIVTGSPATIRRIARILELADRPGAGRKLEIVPLAHAGAEELARQLNEALREELTAEERFQRRAVQTATGLNTIPTEVRVIAQPRINALLLVGPERDVEKVKKYVALLDVEAPAGRQRLTSIALKYLDPKTLAEQLGKVYTQRAAAEPERAGEVAIEADAASGSIIVSAPPEEVALIQSLVETLDVPQDQVMIEVVVAELTSQDRSDLGIQWAYLDLPDQNGEVTVLGASRFPSATTGSVGDIATTAAAAQGLGFAVASGTFTDAEGNVVPRTAFLLSALRDNADYRLLSNPTLWTRNNTEASFDVVEDIPILQSVVEGGTGTARDIRQILERETVGIKLKVTPRVSDNGDVTMQINPVVEAILAEQTGEQQYTPRIARRSINTTVTIHDGDTLAISGLLRDTVVDGVQKIPFFGDIPILGKAFRRDTQQIERTNLIVFLTPHLMRTAADAAAVTRTLEQSHRLGADQLKQELERGSRQQSFLDWLLDRAPSPREDLAPAGAPAAPAAASE